MLNPLIELTEKEKKSLLSVVLGNIVTEQGLVGKEFKLDFLINFGTGGMVVALRGENSCGFQRDILFLMYSGASDSCLVQLLHSLKSRDGERVEFS